ncbi:hypothetical protein BGW38_008036 [Lunasporangiospora selenospora]|uniref:BD-FAE-like domain-containing protein n=1 Tax=Lunasporangiospora selenospora TaxID=979761 RepID=A0A9P6K9W8_9FUNG|nr:hypothetical protein BGW38_008036 [Lunasporangiospora selenospora]
MELDIYRPNSVQGGDDRPVLFYIHGFGWTHGSKSLIGPLATEMVTHDWIVVSINYRLGAKAGYPTQFLDCKRALRWVKDEIRVFGGNPDNIVVAGDEAGGQMASLLAMTANVKEYQPGFEEVDTSVQGVVALSPILDLTDVENHSQHEVRGRFVKEVAKREGSPESVENLKFLTEHSPRFRIKSTGVPFMVVHGDLDILVPVQNTRSFVKEFKNKCSAPITYLEVPGGHHCFHLISSPRSWYVTITVAQWLNFRFADDSTAGLTKASSQGIEYEDFKEKQRQLRRQQGRKLQVHEIVEWGWKT